MLRHGCRRPWLAQTTKPETGAATAIVGIVLPRGVHWLQQPLARPVPSIGTRGQQRKRIHQRACPFLCSGPRNGSMALLSVLAGWLAGHAHNFLGLQQRTMWTVDCGWGRGADSSGVDLCVKPSTANIIQWNWACGREFEAACILLNMKLERPRWRSLTRLKTVVRIWQTVFA